MNKSRTRTHDIHLQLDDKEYAALERNRAKCSLSQQNYLRKLVLNKAPKETPPVEFFEVLRSLQQINNNMNQIAVVANHKGFIDTAAYWENVRWLQKSVGLMMEAMYG